MNLRWYEGRPLFGRRVIVTRARDQASELVACLRELGAETIEMPVIEIGEAADGGAALRAAARSVGGYDWLVFSSINGVDRLFAALSAVGGDARRLAGVSVAAIGPGTASALARHGVRADLVPGRFVAEALVETFPAGKGRVLLARAAVARDALPVGLAAKGWSVDVVEAYRTHPGRPSPEALRAAARADAVTFTSSSTVMNFVRIATELPRPPVVACIGPVTAATAREAGLEPTVVAEEHTIAGLVQALTGALGGGQRSRRPR